MFIAVLDDVHFVNTGSGNATLGTCTNYSVQFDTHIGGIEMSRNKSYGTVKGQCFSNNNDAAGGQNTITFTNNTISHSTGAACGGILHYDSSTHSLLEDNLLFGYAAIIDLAVTTGATLEGGWIVKGNNVDTSGCTITGGQPGSIQFGSASSNTAVGPVSLIGNNGYTTPLISQFSGSSATMQGWTIVDNNTTQASSFLLGGSGGAGIPCTPFQSQPCYIGANPGYPPNANLNGAMFPGFVVQMGNMGHFFALTQAANFGPSNIGTGANIAGGLSTISCVVEISQAATTSSTMPTCSISWTDLLTSVVQTVVVTTTSGANTVGTQSQGTVYAAIKAATNVTVTTASYVSLGGTPMQYAVFADIQKAY